MSVCQSVCRSVDLQRVSNLVQMSRKQYAHVYHARNRIQNMKCNRVLYNTKVKPPPLLIKVHAIQDDVSNSIPYRFTLKKLKFKSKLIITNVPHQYIYDLHKCNFRRLSTFLKLSLKPFTGIAMPNNLNP